MWQLQFCGEKDEKADAVAGAFDLGLIQRGFGLGGKVRFTPAIGYQDEDGLFAGLAGIRKGLPHSLFPLADPVEFKHLVGRGYVSVRPGTFFSPR